MVLAVNKKKRKKSASKNDVYKIVFLLKWHWNQQSSALSKRKQHSCTYICEYLILRCDRFFHFAAAFGDFVTDFACITKRGTTNNH